ncbi:MAG TPA: malto-oligosyltrehalose trehalohydrolase [Candidatus Acidoferrales bacterium]|nr:malto-oligosyltrehalose trehalohydrolase [Candidatus Acidoferrales bacterium]
MRRVWGMRFGASVEGSGVRFRLWAPRLHAVQVAIAGQAPRTVPMEPEAGGEFVVYADGVSAGADYRFLTDGGRQLPDPVSRWQPDAVHGPSRVVDPASFDWSDQAWRGIPLEQLVIYELHTGTFTPDGTFDRIIPQLPYLCDLGVTAIELMPVAQFPGSRNWGYDGVDLYAPQSSYGGPNGLKRLVDACHRSGVAVVLDVVYNHLGPEGNYLAEFGPYFTDSYRTPWGQAINYDGAGSDGVRRFFVENALYWLTEYHVDALRLDAIHGIFDFSACHILQEMASAFHAQAEELGRRAFLIAESDLNDARVIRPRDLGGYGVDAQWLDDFHHSLYTAFAPDARGYFADFEGLRSLGKALQNGFVYEGQHSVYRGRRHGSSSRDCPGRQFVAFTQNHDQIGNARGGIRPAEESSLSRQKLAAAVLLFAPYIPLLFMGQEYGETAGFYYFTEHGDAALVQAVREGRRSEVGAFLPGVEFLDPQHAATFARSKLKWDLHCRAPHSGILAWYRDCTAARKGHAALANCRKDLVRTEWDSRYRWLVLERGDPSGAAAMLVCNFADAPQAVEVPFHGVPWSLRMWSGDARYGPPCAPPAARIGEGTSSALEMAPVSAALYFGT